MSEPTKEALDLAERIKRYSYIRCGDSEFNVVEAAENIDEYTASLREELRAAREDSLGGAIEAACQRLPAGWKVVIQTHCGLVQVSLQASYETKSEADHKLAEELLLAIEKARAASKGGDAV
jgi:hypothetical protein